MKSLKFLNIVGFISPKIFKTVENSWFQGLIAAVGIPALNDLTEL